MRQCVDVFPDEIGQSFDHQCGQRVRVEVHSGFKYLYDSMNFLQSVLIPLESFDT